MNKIINYDDTEYMLCEDDLPNIYIDLSVDDRFAMFILFETQCEGTIGHSINFAKFSGQYFHDGAFYTFKGGYLHSYDGRPALWKEVGDYSLWMNNGERHRENGPYMIHNGSLRWALNNKGYTFREYLECLSDDDKVFVLMKYGNHYAH